jgi:DNA (cytosine-5)-methyltransferase 1
MTLTFGSLFAGIGGFDLGFERAGMVCRWQVEIDDYCRTVLAKHWPDVTRYEDVRECGRANLEPVDLVCGGFPCQPFSAAGKRRGAEDDRNLWPEFRRIIAEVKPRWVVAENVPGIVKIYLDTVLSDLEGLGYTTAQVVIPACAVDAPHRRDRLWIVAYCKNVTDVFRRRHKSSGQSSENGCHRLRTGSIDDRLVLRSNETLPTDGATVAESLGHRPQGQLEAGATPGPTIRDGSRWPVEPPVGRVAHGIPRRVDRLRALGNAVVPQVAEFIGRLIVEADAITSSPVHGKPSTL